MDKLAILKMIEDRRVTQATPALSSQQSSGVFQVPQIDLRSDGAVHEGCTSLISGVPTDPSIERSNGDDVPP